MASPSKLSIPNIGRWPASYRPQRVSLRGCLACSPADQTGSLCARPRGPHSKPQLTGQKLPSGGAFVRAGIAGASREFGFRAYLSITAGSIARSPMPRLTTGEELANPMPAVLRSGTIRNNSSLLTRYASRADLT